jgi:murein DD-endopeptidase MepM/ murein hydrolase activator NlpD
VSVDPLALAITMELVDLVSDRLGNIIGSMKEFISTGLEMNSLLETSELQFKTLQGSAAEATGHVAELFDIAKRTPFTFEGILESSRSLEVFGGSLLDTKANLILFGDAAAATGADIQDLTYWTGRLYTQLQSGGSIAGPERALQRLAVLTPEVRLQMEAMVKQGKSGQEIFDVYTRSLERFGGAMEAQSQTWKGLTATMDDQFKLLAGRATQGMFAALEEDFKALNQVLGDPRTLKTAEDLGNALGFVTERASTLGISLVDVGARLFETLPAVEAYRTAMLGIHEAQVLVAGVASETQGALAGGGQQGGAFAGLETDLQGIKAMLGDAGVLQAVDALKADIAGVGAAAAASAPAFAGWLAVIEGALPPLAALQVALQALHELQDLHAAGEQALSKGQREEEETHRELTRGIEAHAESQRRLGDAVGDTAGRIQDEIKAVADARKALGDTNNELAKAIQLQHAYSLHPAQSAEDAQREADRAKKALEPQKAAFEEYIDGRKRGLEIARDQAIEMANQERDGRVAAIKAEAKEVDREFAAEGRAANDARDAALRAAEHERDGALKALQQQEHDVEQSYKQQTAAKEKERDAQLADADHVRDAAVAGLKAEQEAAAVARRDADRERQDARAREDRDLADSRAQRDRAEQAGHQALLDRIHAEGQAQEDGLKQEQAARDATLKADLAALDAREQAERRASDAALRGLDELERKERERHDAALRQYDEQAAAALKPIQAQLDAFAALSNRQGAARQDRQQRAGLQAAQQDLGAARQSGDRAAIARAQAAVEAARDQISQTAEQRRQAAAEQALRAQMARIQQEAEARKAAENDRTQQAQAATKAQQQAEHDRLAGVLDGLNTQKDATRAAADADKQDLGARLEQAKAYWSGRTDEENRGYAAAQQGRAADRQAFDRDLQDRRTAEDRALADSRTAEDTSLAERTKAVQVAYEAERDQVKATYDDPVTGVLAKIHAAEDAEKLALQGRREAVQAHYQFEQEQARDTYEATERAINAAKDAAHDAFDKRTADANTAYDNEQKRIAAVFTDPGTGLLPALDKLKADSEAILISGDDSQVKLWEAWFKAIAGENGSIPKAKKALQDFLDLLPKDAQLAVTTKIDPGGVTPGTSADRPQAPRDDRVSASGIPLAGRGGSAAFPIVRAATSVTNTAHGTHEGGPAADIFAPAGSPIYAPIGGVSMPHAYPLGGNTTTLKGDNGLWYYMAHGRVPFADGTVEAGQQIGEVGNTGNAAQTASHVHFAITDDGDFSRGKNGGSGDIWPDGSYWAGAPNLPVVGEGPGGQATLTAQQIALQPLGDAGPTFLVRVAQTAAAAGGDIAKAIIADATALGFVNPNRAVEVALTEGGVTEWARPGDFNTNGVPSSFGPFQLHYGGLGYPHSAYGLGDAFTATTGLDARDPASGPAGVLYALQQAKAGGWGPWHGWKGDPMAGIDRYAQGGVVPGAKGAPRPAIVHGGEWILNPDQQAKVGLTDTLPAWMQTDIRLLRRTLVESLGQLKRDFDAASAAHDDARAKADEAAARRLRAEYDRRAAVEKAHPAYEAAVEAQPELRELLREAAMQGNLAAAAEIRGTWETLLATNKATLAHPGRESFDALGKLGYRWSGDALVAPWDVAEGGPQDYFGLAAPTGRPATAGVGIGPRVGAAESNDFGQAARTITQNFHAPVTIVVKSPLDSFQELALLGGRR